jgi:hypothetical protein
MRISSFAGSPFASSISVCRPFASSVCCSLEVGAIGPHFFRLSQFQIVEIAGREPVGDVDEQERRAGQTREIGDVRQDRLVGGRVLDRDQDALVHRRNLTAS